MMNKLWYAIELEQSHVILQNYLISVINLFKNQLLHCNKGVPWNKISKIR